MYTTLFGAYRLVIIGTALKLGRSGSCPIQRFRSIRFNRCCASYIARACRSEAGVVASRDSLPDPDRERTTEDSSVDRVS